LNLISGSQDLRGQPEHREELMGMDKTWPLFNETPVAVTVVRRNQKEEVEELIQFSGQNTHL
jgi:hypothetical protein